MSVLVALSLVACLEPVEVQVGTPGVAPAVAVSPRSLVFPVADVGDTLVESLTITSAGTETLVLETLEISDGDFRLLTPLQDLELVPGETLKVDVAWTVGERSSQVATVTLTSDDPGRGTLLIPLSGERGLGELAFDHHHDFGILEVGCQATALLSLENTGTGAATVEAISLDGGAFALIELPALPLALAVGARLDVEVAFNPSDAGDLFGALEVHSDLGQTTAQLYGTAEHPPGAVVSSASGTPLPVDLLLLVDSSSSMREELDALEQAFPHLIDGLESEGLDWQLASVDDPSACAAPHVLDSPDDAEVDRFLEGLGENSLANGRLLSLGALALEQTVVAGCNEAFLRPDSLVHLVMASDRPEESPGTWDSYVGRMHEAIGEEEHLRLSAFVGSDDEGYAQATEATGGILMPFGVPDLAEQLFALAEASASCDGRSWVELPEGVDPDSVVVLRDGLEESGFSVDAANGLVLLDEPVECGQIVEVRFRSWPVCD